MSHIQNLRRGAAALAVAAAFGVIASAQAADPGETYYNTAYLGAGLDLAFSKAVRQATGDNLGGIRAKAFIGKLEDKIKNAGDKPQHLVWPDSAANGQTVIGGAIPTKTGLEHGSLFACVLKTAARFLTSSFSPAARLSPMSGREHHSLPAQQAASTSSASPSSCRPSAT